MGMRAAPAATMLLIGLVGALGEASAQYYPAPSPRNYPAPTYRQVPPVERQAALGRYLLEIRNALNNSLTSVLGNSELLLSEPEDLSPAAGLQIETIRNMAVRMHEMLQRFTSLEKELKLIEKQEVTEAETKAQQVSASS